MFRPDVSYFKRFYRSTLGALVYRTLRQRIRTIWPDFAMHETMLGIGYTTPYLVPFIHKEEAVNAGVSIAVMPEMQGVIHWPEGKENLSLLSQDMTLPFEDGSVERVLVAHSLEFSSDPLAMLHEIWRVLAPNGKLVVIAPNRQSLWARIENTPFGYGQPFSTSQMAKLLEEAAFTTHDIKSDLFFLPSSSRFMLHAAGIWHAVGKWLYRPLGGVIVVEAEKHIHALTPEFVKKKSFSFNTAPSAN